MYITQNVYAFLMRRNL